jgi:anti-anti-sigma factor
MDIVEVPKGPALTLEFRGRLDMSTCPAVQERLLRLVDTGNHALAFDLSGLDYISSAGLRVLLSTLKKVKSCNGKIAIYGTSDHVKRIFEIVGFAALFPMYPNAAEALKAFRWNHPLTRFVRADRCGPNAEGYFGETIDIDALQQEILRAAREHHWTAEPFLDANGCQLFALSRLSPTASKSAYLCSGIHGDEPAPPLAILNLLWQNQWPADWNFYICPCLNPHGFRMNRRSNADGTDLNRDYRDRKSSEIRAHIQWLERQPAFSVTASLHEDWESTGFYAYHLGPLSVEPVIQFILERVEKVCPIDQSSTIDHLPAENGVLDQALHSLQMNEKLIDGLAETVADTALIKRHGSVWTEQTYLINHKTRVSYTFESASAMPMETRVKALTQAVTALLSCPHEIF